MTSVAFQVLQKLDRGLITVDQAGRTVMQGGSNVSHRKRWATAEIPTPYAMTLPTMFGGESSVLWM
jgi:hypothetical protein